MPLYDYRCLDCGHAFQVVETLGEHEDHATHPQTCAACGSEKVERVFTGAFVKTSRKS